MWLDELKKKLTDEIAGYYKIVTGKELSEITKEHYCTLSIQDQRFLVKKWEKLADDKKKHDHIVATFKYYLGRQQGYAPSPFRKAIYDTLIFADNYKVYQEIASAFPEELEVIYHWKTTGEIK